MSKALENMTQQELILKVKQLESTNQQLETGVQHLESQAQHLESEKQHLESENQQLESQKQHLQFRIDQLNRLLFGAKRERYISNQQIEGQMELPFEVEEKPVDEEKVEQITYTRKKKQRQNHPGRTPLPDHLPVEEIILEPKEDTTGLKCIGKEVTDKLELVPARLSCEL